MNLSNEQIAIRDFLTSNKTTSLIVDAKAGSGKTSTIVHCANLLPSGSIFVAFNKAIASELASKLPHKAMTFHSLGLSILRDRFTKVKVDNWKYTELLKKKNFGTNTRPYVDLINAALTAGLGLRNLPSMDDDNLRELLLTAQIDVPKEVTEQLFIERTLTIIKLALKDFKTVTFSEMIYLPLYYAQRKKWNLSDYPCIVVDEAQDISPVRLALLTACTPRVVAVGDPCQAIYGFAGATRDVLSTTQTTYGAHSLPLSISWRCANSIISEAQSIIGKRIFARPDAPDGTVDECKVQDISFSSLDANTAILCRTNAPLFSLAVQLLSAGQSFNFRSDFPAILTRLVKKLAKKNTLICNLLNALQTYSEEMYEEHGERRPALYNKIADQVACIRILAKKATSVEDCLNLLTTVTRAETGLTLSTIHKSKGLEWNHVYIYRPDLIPAPWAVTDWDLEQEHNLLYVAITRAINHLTYIQQD